MLSGISDWMAVNREGIYGTRPWKVYGEGPSVLQTVDRQSNKGFNEKGRKYLTAQDIRFTAKGDTIYAFIMGWPGKEVLIKPLAANSSPLARKVQMLELLGHEGKLNWTQDESALKVQMPNDKPCDYAVTLKIALA